MRKQIYMLCLCAALISGCGQKEVVQSADFSETGTGAVTEAVTEESVPETRAEAAEQTKAESVGETEVVIDFANFQYQMPPMDGKSHNMMVYADEKVTAFSEMTMISHRETGIEQVAFFSQLIPDNEANVRPFSEAPSVDTKEDAFRVYDSAYRDGDYQRFAIALGEVGAFKRSLEGEVSTDSLTKMLSKELYLTRTSDFELAESSDGELVYVAAVRNYLQYNDERLYYTGVAFLHPVEEEGYINGVFYVEKEPCELPTHMKDYILQSLVFSKGDGE